MTAATARRRIVSNLERMELLELVDAIALEHLCQAVGSGNVAEIGVWHGQLGLTEGDRTRIGPRPSDDPSNAWSSFRKIGRPTLAELLASST